MKRIKQPWNPYRHYRFAEDFMERGGIYGRSVRYPYRAYRIPRIFRKVISLNRLERSFSQHSKWDASNAIALDKSVLHPIFAYECRPRPWRGIPGGGGEYRETPLPVLDTDDSSAMLMDFKITLPKAA